VKLLAASAEGLAPTVKLVCGKTMEPGSPVNAEEFPVPPESKLRGDGGSDRRRKKLAGLPLCARSSTWRPLCTSERESEKIHGGAWKRKQKKWRGHRRGQRRRETLENPFSREDLLDVGEQVGPASSTI